MRIVNMSVHFICYCRCNKLVTMQSLNCSSIRPHSWSRNNNNKLEISSNVNTIFSGFLGPITKQIRCWLVFKLNFKYKYMLWLSRNSFRRFFGTKQPNPKLINYYEVSHSHIEAIDSHNNHGLEKYVNFLFAADELKFHFRMVVTVHMLLYIFFFRMNFIVCVMRICRGGWGEERNKKKRMCFAVCA